jgi:acetyltransferase-like isoleucine patch superfamily enzyme
VTIGDGAIVGAGAVVAKSLPAGCVAVGTPARVVGWRGGVPPE